MDSLLDSKTLVTTKPSGSRFRAIIYAIFASIGIFALLWVSLVWSKDGLSSSYPQPRVAKAVAVLTGSLNVTGTVYFSQPRARGPITISGVIRGLAPNSLRGFHVHENGDLTNGCNSTGVHYNPFWKTHGAPTDSNRHLGGLGNVRSNNNSVACFTIQDGQLSLNGRYSILGRGIVVHAATDDLGRGGNEESLKTGNSGPRLACGVIGYSL